MKKAPKGAFFVWWASKKTASPVLLNHTHSDSATASAKHPYTFAPNHGWFSSSVVAAQVSCLPNT
jgi:hypothetical protein